MASKVHASINGPKGIRLEIQGTPLSAILTCNGVKLGTYPLFISESGALGMNTKNRRRISRLLHFQKGLEFAEHVGSNLVYGLLRRWGGGGVFWDREKKKRGGWRRECGEGVTPPYNKIHFQ
jgi:hypothetical protein